MSITTLSELSRVYVPEIDRAISRYYESHPASEIDFVRTGESVLKEYCLRPGKRLRPLLVVAVYLGYSGEKTVPEGVFDVAAAAEVIHASFLVHDDIIDKADTRRSFPSMNRLLHTMYASSSFNAAVGYDEAIIFGDQLIFGAMDMISRAKLDPEMKCGLMAQMNETCRMTAWGQALDVLYTKPQMISPDDGIPGAIGEMKTAYYTITGPMLLGLRLSGCYCDGEAGIIREASLSLGAAFQLRDDLLGVFGDEKNTGKPNDSDLAEGKYTLLVQKAWSLLDGQDKKSFEQIFSLQSLSGQDLSALRSLIVKSGAREWAMAELKKQADFSRRLFSTLSADDAAKSVISDLCDFISAIHIC
ncbi:MAG: polyprenyl synthetase family protein [Spirochaetota bacterium]